MFTLHPTLVIKVSICFAYVTLEANIVSEKIILLNNLLIYLFFNFKHIRKSKYKSKKLQNYTVKFVKYINGESIWKNIKK
ncbi:hypothetical protein N476_07705 [Pseudoalteromonas luteoviolacea H33]|uniref:Uncharacterized protein n=1 Tax=Pseudoalteromonas luteoviolacea H33 TaxID=1365251 RepID=A0A167G3H1_9GAMM|nr:hypothetical protein N476_07705 [Pseudoalteromonas luteoviolacea H33]